MSTEQLRAEFEAWWNSEHPMASPLKETRTNRRVLEGRVLTKGHALTIWTAARAALQSQDREDALRYRALVASGHFVPASTPYSNIWGLRTTEGKATKAELDAAIDHARRVEGE